ncbi:hypothetical protein PUATCC27989T_00433 [Phytobacter ursingii]|nr:hypothetical protein PUATCC27989T_00433 [Phytobacter ursingii]
MTTQLPIPKEQVQKFIEDCEDLISRGFDVEVFPIAMARALLAAYEQDPYWWAIENRHGDARFVEEEHAKNDIWDEVHELNEKDDNGEYFDDNAPYKVVPVYRRPVLAAYEQEPVAYMCDGDDGREYNGHNEFSCGGLGIPLYTHPAPSIPAVPDEKALSDLRERLADVVGVRFSDDDDVLAIFDACRAAMLNGGKS